MSLLAKLLLGALCASAYASRAKSILDPGPYSPPTAHDVRTGERSDGSVEHQEQEDDWDRWVAVELRIDRRLTSEGAYRLGQQRTHDVAAKYDTEVDLWPMLPNAIEVVLRHGSDGGSVEAIGCVWILDGKIVGASARVNQFGHAGFEAGSWAYPEGTITVDREELGTGTRLVVDFDLSGTHRGVRRRLRDRCVVGLD